MISRRKNVRSLRNRNGLIRYAYNHTSQNGEDGIIEHLFSIIPPSMSSTVSEQDHKILPTCRYCVDVGAWDGKHLSNTYSLLVKEENALVLPLLLLPPGPSSCDTVQQKQQQQQQDPRERRLDLLQHHKRQQPPSNVVDQSDSISHDTQISDHLKSTSFWHGILLEANLERFQQLQALHQKRGNVCRNVAVSGMSDSPCTLAHILKEIQMEQYQQHRQQGVVSSTLSNDWVLPHQFDFLCIDVDGEDYWILYDLWTSSTFRPIVVCIEFNPTMPDDLIYIPPRDDTLRHGASLAALVELGEQHDYVLVETTLFNAFFVRKDSYNTYLRQYIPDTSIEALHEVTMGTALYQLYDGTIKLWGCKKLLWHRLSLDESQFQLLSPSQRSFPFAPPPSSVATNSIASKHDFDEASVVDISSYCRTAPSGCNLPSIHQEDDKLTCAQNLLTQFQAHGFCFVRGTGLSNIQCQKVLAMAGTFLHDADETVRRSCLSRDRARRGYSPMVSAISLTSLIFGSCRYLSLASSTTVH
jgi:hypothetical protein